MTTKTRRLARLEACAPQPLRRPDLSHLTDQQLDLIESCVDRSTGQCDQASLAALPAPHADSLLAALQSIDGRGYRQLRATLGVAYSKQGQARVGRLNAIGGSTTPHCQAPGTFD